MIGTPEVDDSKSRMNVHSIVGTPSFSLAKECNRLCKTNERYNGFKGHSKNKKRGVNTKVKKRLYYLQNKNDIEMVE